MEYLEQYISVSSNQYDGRLQITKIDKAFKVHCGGVTLKNRFLPRRKRKCCYLVKDPVITLFE